MTCLCVAGACILPSMLVFYFFYFNAPSTTDIYTLSLHDALPICHKLVRGTSRSRVAGVLVRKSHPLRSFAHAAALQRFVVSADRKSTRLNSSHVSISYAVFCLKKKKKIKIHVYTLTHRIKVHHIK